MIRKAVPTACIAVLFTFAGSAQAVSLVGLANSPAGGQSLVMFDSATPGTVSTLGITGLGANEVLLGIDRRPLTGQLYGLSNQNRLVTLNLNTGAALGVGTGFTTALVGTSFGFDFNPQIDRIRIVSNADQNIVAHPMTGAANVAATTPVFYPGSDVNGGANPNVVHHAYDRNFAGTGATLLRAIDTNLDILVTQANNAGTLGTIGALGVDATEVGGFDVAAGGAAFAIFNSGGTSSQFYSINLMTGAATSLGAVPGVITGLTAIPEPSTIALGMLVAVGAITARRTRRA